MTESYELPVLFTDDECKAYAAWGMKKEKVLMPFALITILIYYGSNRVGSDEGLGCAGE